jgi:predicted nucleotidyltransferase
MSDPGPEAALADVARHLRQLDQPFALVGGLAVSLRAEVRFTRDIDLAIAVADDAEVERLVYDLRGDGYTAIALVEHQARKRLATVRLASPAGLIVDLLAASTGIEAEIVARAIPVAIEEVGEVPVARAEELLAMKVLSMTDRRLQDRIDAINLVLTNEALDLDAVRNNLERITERGFHRDQDLLAKLAGVLDAARDEG